MDDKPVGTDIALLGADDDESLSLARVETAQERNLRLRRFLSRVDAMTQITDNVANGGSIISIAKVLNVRPNNILTWIRADAERFKLYEAALRDRDDWERETVLSQLRHIGNFDIKDIFSDEGGIKPISEWSDSASAAVSGIEVNELFDGKGDEKTNVGVAKKIKLIDKIKALELSGKRLAMFKDKVEHTGYVTLEQLVLGVDESGAGETH